MTARRATVVERGMTMGTAVPSARSRGRSQEPRRARSREPHLHPGPSPAPKRSRAAAGAIAGAIPRRRNRGATRVVAAEIVVGAGGIVEVAVVVVAAEAGVAEPSRTCDEGPPRFVGGP